ncbi:MAG: dipeptide ABC transporter ATP-binding protein [Gemmobacter sp.]
MTGLVVEGLTVAARLPGGRAEVLRDLSLAVPPGRVVGLVGESGAGKSMVGRVLAGTLPPGFAVTAGSARFDGADLAALAPAPRRALLGDRIAFIPQEPLTALNPLMTVGAQFGEHLGRLGVAAADRGARMVAALGAVRLPDPAAILNRYPFQLSGGQNQRVLIAMAFASRPALIVADEPTTALDVSTQVTIIALIRALQADHGTGMIFVTHDLRLAARVCDEIVVLYAGEAVEAGPAAAVMADPRHPYTRSLRAAIPGLAGPRLRLAPLGGAMPGLSALAALSGCRFAPRCPVADPACAAARPAPRAVAPGHRIRCTAACGAGAAALRPEPLPPPPAQGPEVLRLTALAKRFPAPRNWIGLRRGAPVDAVRGVTLTVRAGEFVGVVGESGSGKSTLARLVMGLEVPTWGRIAIDGRDVTAGTGPARSIRLGALQMVFQDPQSALNPRRTVRRLVTQAMEALRRGDRTDPEARARGLLRETGLPADLLDRFPAQLSGGQKQRVNIARALCVAPRLLVADEIVSGLDVSVQAQILNLLLDLRIARGIGLVLISHDLGVVRYLCDRVLVMQAGDVVEEGPVEAVFADPQHPYTRLLIASIPPDDPAAPWAGDRKEIAHA